MSAWRGTYKFVIGTRKSFSTKSLENTKEDGWLRCYLQGGLPARQKTQGEGVRGGAITEKHPKRMSMTFNQPVRHSVRDLCWRVPSAVERRS